MVWYQELRERWLGPCLTLMANSGIRPDHLTLVSLLLGLLFVPLIFWVPWAAFAVLLLHAIVDGLDGPLARKLATASRAGSFTDTMSDQLVLVVVTVTMMCHPERYVGVLPGSVYIFLYTVVVVFAIVRNAMGIPYSWLVRPRFVVYVWLALEVFCFQGTAMVESINILLWVFNALFVLKLATGFFKIRKKL